MRVVFMGTPAFAVPTLRALAATQAVVGVVTQPDAPAGRGRALSASAVKEAALDLGLPIQQPETLRTPEAVAALAAWHPDVIVVAAFGQILRRAVLELPPLGCLNVHASLLPRWRGASPVPAAIAAGDAQTGVTIMRMAAGLDSGPIIAQRKTAITEEDTSETVLTRLADLGAALLGDVLPAYASGALVPVEQDSARVTVCGLIDKAAGRIDWSRSAAEIDRHIRAMTPWPGAFTAWEGKQLRILRARIAPDGGEPGLPGTVTARDKRILVFCGRGALSIEEAQL
ncbi:MAG: methionyl-tRNA formyltransferase, partial [Thermoflexales bacterium]|nr:methionyl-tRNA formyltransferase [Thermoflexales bacterium]